MTPAEKLAENKPKKPPKPPKTLTFKPMWKCNIFEIRERLGLSQGAVALALGMNQTGYTDIEYGRDIKLSNASKVAKFYGKTIEELWQPLEEKP